MFKSSTEGYDSLRKAIEDTHLLLEVAKQQIYDKGKKEEYKQLHQKCQVISKPIHPEAFTVYYSEIKNCFKLRKSTKYVEKM